VNVATFAIFPDGTTMQIDCGDLDIKTYRKKHGKKTEFYPKLDFVSPYPNSSKTTGQWVIDYIHHFWPHKQANIVDRKAIDYMMITHFHQQWASKVTTFVQGLLKLEMKLISTPSLIVDTQSMIFPLI
jgi:hypothetical protein